METNQKLFTFAVIHQNALCIRTNVKASLLQKLAVFFFTTFVCTRSLACCCHLLMSGIMWYECETVGTDEYRPHAPACEQTKQETNCSIELLKVKNSTGRLLTLRLNFTSSTSSSVSDGKAVFENDGWI